MNYNGNRHKFFLILFVALCDNSSRFFLVLFEDRELLDSEEIFDFELLANTTQHRVHIITSTILIQVVKKFKSEAITRNPTARLLYSEDKQNL